MKYPSNQKQSPVGLKPQGGSNSIISKDQNAGAAYSGEMDMVHAAASKRALSHEEKDRSFINRFFVERGLTEVIQKARVEEFTNIKEYEARLFRLATDTKLEACHEAALRMTREIKVEFRQQFSAFVMEKELLVRQSMEAHQEEFAASVERGYQLAKKYENRPFLRDLQRRAVETNAARYYDFTMGLMENFRAIVEERINQYQITE